MMKKIIALILAVVCCLSVLYGCGGESSTEAAYKVMYEGTEVQETFSELMTRQKKSEAEDAGWL